MNKKSMLRNLIMMGTLLLLLVAAAVAWFISMTHGSMDNTSFDSAEAIESQVVTSGGYSGQLLDMTVYMIPCSGTGETDPQTGKADLYTAVTEPFTESQPMEGTWQRAYGQDEAQIDYANQVAYLSYLDYYSVVTATHPARLALGSASKVFPVVAEYDGTDPEHPDRKIKSDYGDFSVDNIAGAVRVAFIICTPNNASDVTDDLGFDNQGRLCNIRSYDEVSGEPDDYDLIPYTEQLVMIWIPNDTYQITEQYTDISGSGVMALTGADFTAEGTPEAEYRYYDHGAGEVTTYAEGSCCTDSMLGQAGFIQLADSLWHNTAKGNYCACVKIRIWVEGYDREASIALAEGMFDSEIYLLTIQEAS